MARNNDIKYADLLNLIAKEVRGNSTPDMARKYLEAIIRVIMAELKLNGRIYFNKFGAFETFETGGGDKRMGNPEGGTVIRYIHPKTKIRFKPSSVIEKCINEYNFEVQPKKHKGRTKIQEKIVSNERRRKPQLTMEDLVTEMLNKK